jgi:hypothetical protein
MALDQLRSQTPATQYERVRVTFGAADTDTVIPHGLRPPSADHVDYQVIRADRATSLYHTIDGKAWAAGFIVLRSSAADATVTLLLTVPYGVPEL